MILHLIYMSKEFLLLKTISVMVHKDALPKNVMKKADINSKAICEPEN